MTGLVPADNTGAGMLTPLVAGFARLFYAHRQKRWRALAKNGFHALRK